ncbi:MAG: rep [Moraxellaceae bacterium]|jgi:superfamily I DNA/RNA helicase|nr:rep [Moraxellaceae bacterium]
MGEAVDAACRRAGIPASWLNRNSHSRRQQGADAVSIVTFHSSKGLEFPVVAIPSIGYLSCEQDDVNEEVRLMYVGMTRAMDRLVMTCHQRSAFAAKLEGVPAVRLQMV